MSLTPGSTPHLGSRPLTLRESNETRRIWELIQVVKSQGGLLASILTALGGSTTTYNTIQSYLLGASDTKTISGGTIHSIGISILTGTADVSLDGGSTSSTYPAGANVNFTASGYFISDITITTASGSSALISTTTNP